MRCPRCNSEWDLRQNPCPRCGFVMRMPTRSDGINNQALPEVIGGQALLEKGSLLSERSMQSSESISPPGGQTRESPGSGPFRSRLLPLPAGGNSVPEKRPMQQSISSTRLPPLKSHTSILHIQSPSPSSQSLSGIANQQGVPPLVPGNALQGGRYILQKAMQAQEWLPGVFETTWSARDTRQTDAPVVVHELLLGNVLSPQVRTIPETARQVFSSFGSHPGVPKLRETFSEQARHFFIFEPTYGFSLLTSMRSAGGKLSERDVVDCCLQITGVLNHLTRQSVPLAHGNIRPEQIIKKRPEGQYVLTNFSIALAGGATRFAVNVGRLRLSPYAAPEITAGEVSIRSDLYALLATAYHLLTGHRPNESVSDPLPSFSAHFQDILARGLHVERTERYQHPAELYRDLLTMCASLEYQSQNSLSHFSAQVNSALHTQVPERPPSGLFSPDISSSPSAPVQVNAEQPDLALLVPLPEDLKPLREVPDLRNAVIWFVGMLLCLSFLFLGRGLV